MDEELFKNSGQQGKAKQSKESEKHANRSIFEQASPQGNPLFCFFSLKWQPEPTEYKGFCHDLLSVFTKHLTTKFHGSINGEKPLLFTFSI